jgi:hypothetical protein
MTNEEPKKVEQPPIIPTSIYEGQQEPGTHPMFKGVDIGKM